MKAITKISNPFIRPNGDYVYLYKVDNYELINTDKLHRKLSHQIKKIDIIHNEKGNYKIEFGTDNDDFINDKTSIRITRIKVK